MERYLLKCFQYAAVFLCIAFLCGFWLGCQVDNAANEQKAFTENEDYQFIAGTDAVIADMLVSGSDYYPGDTVKASLMIVNAGSRIEGLWIGCSVRDPLGNWYDLPAKEISLESGEITSVEFFWLTPEEIEQTQILSGPYLLTITAWSERPDFERAERLATVKQEEAFFVVRYLEDFTAYNEEKWEKSSHPLGLGNLDPGNVEIEDDLLKITLPAGTYNGGQLESREHEHLYGSYRAKIKLPHAPSSITGFFLYRSPDYYHEIDIEIVNDPSGLAWFTTYADGEVSNTYETYLDIDPTGDFHEYRFDFYPGSVSFYVDNMLIETFNEGLTDTPMKLMVNSWFPHWIEGIKPEQDAVTLVDWIKH